MVSHSPGRNSWPLSRGSCGSGFCLRLLTASVMDPFPRFANEMEMQMKIEQRQSGIVLLHYLANEFFVDRLAFEQNLHRLNPGFVNLAPAGFFVAVSQMEADKAKQLVRRAGFNSFFQKWD